MTSEAVSEQELVLCIGDTTYLDYGKIKAKREGYGPTGNGGNGLILHSALALTPEQGQVIGLLWQKLWNREPKAKPPQDETAEAKKQRLALARKASRQRLFKDKESYRWVEAMTEVEHQVSSSTHVIHIFDREGDITEVFEQVRQLQHTGVLVRAAHDRSIFISDVKLWIPAYSEATYPDIMVIEDEPTYYGNSKTTVTNPSLIVEVLSKSTQNYDQGEKFYYYRSIPEFKEYILISQYQYYVMQFNKTNQGKWLLSEYRNDDSAISLQTVKFDISFEDIYENVNLCDLKL